MHSALSVLFLTPQTGDLTCAYYRSPESTPNFVDTSGIPIAAAACTNVPMRWLNVLQYEYHGTCKEGCHSPFLTDITLMNVSMISGSTWWNVNILKKHLVHLSFPLKTPCETLQSWPRVLLQVEMWIAIILGLGLPCSIYVLFSMEKTWIFWTYMVK